MIDQAPDVRATLFSRRSILRLVSDLLAAELSRSRGRSPLLLGVESWNERTVLGAGGLDLDSLERLDASAALSEFFHLAEHGAEDHLLILPTLGDWCDLVAEALATCGTHLTFRTSGSTGVPKRCTHAVADLADEMARWVQLFGPADRIVSMVPSHHIYGTLFTAMLPDRLGIEIEHARAGGTAVMRAEAGTWVIATPTLWAHVARACPILPSGVVGISSTAPMPAALAGQLRAQGLDRLVEIYGASETGGIAYRDMPDASYTLLDVWQHVGDGEVIRSGADGPMRHRLMDHSDWSDDRHFRLIGRRDGAVQVGGVNVFPERVREVLLMHDHVEDAAVRLEPSSHRLKAFIVPTRDKHGDALAGDVDRWCAKHLADVERPRHLTFGVDLPRDTMGKLVDW